MRAIFEFCDVTFFIGRKSDFKFEICWFLWPKKVLWSCSKFAQMMFTIDKCAPFSTFVTSSFLLEENPISSLKFWKIWFKNPLEERPFFSRLKKVEIFLQNEKKRKSFYNLQRLKKVGIFLQNEKKRKSFYNLSANPQPSSHPPF